jgi:hypothetical protein
MAKPDVFKGTDPYASELFGICQPLLGWRFRPSVEAVNRGSLPGTEGR